MLLLEPGSILERSLVKDVELFEESDARRWAQIRRPNASLLPGGHLQPELTKPVRGSLHDIEAERFVLRAHKVHVDVIEFQMPVTPGFHVVGRLHTLKIGLPVHLAPIEGDDSELGAPQCSMLPLGVPILDSRKSLISGIWHIAIGHEEVIGDLAYLHETR